MRILIVEDDRFYAQAISELLEDRQITTTCAYTAQEAVGADATSYVGAIVDVMMPNDPVLSGISVEESRGGFLAGVCVARRLLKQHPGLRIVLLTSDVVNSEAESWAADQCIPFIRKDEGSTALVRTLERIGLLDSEQTPLAFIVHGHDEVALMQLKNFIQNTLKWQEPLILREQPSAGKTTIEKFEDFGRQVDCVFVLMTPDDRVVTLASDTEKRRSRQNVTFELGFFYGALGRRSGRILVLHHGPLELPSDIAGIVWIDISNGIEAAGENLRRETKHIISTFLQSP